VPQKEEQQEAAKAESGGPKEKEGDGRAAADTEG